MLRFNSAFLQVLRMKRLNNFFLIGKVVVIFIFLDCGFRFVGFNTTRDKLLNRIRKIPPAPPSDQDKAALEKIVSAVDAGTRYYYRKRLDCLPRALTMYYLARQQEIPVEFCLGVKKYPFAGHSWMEYQGEIIGDRPNRVKLYTVLVRE
jgi:hypothetical protein